MNVVFNLEETSTADINFGVVFSGGIFPISGTIKWNERNFQGRGQTLGVDLEASPIKQTLGVELPGAVAHRQALVGGRLPLLRPRAAAERAPGFLLRRSSPTTRIPIACPDEPPKITSHATTSPDLAAGNLIPAAVPDDLRHVRHHPRANTGYTFTFPSGGWASRRATRRSCATWTTTRRSTGPSTRNVRDNNHIWNFIDQIAFGVNLDGRDIYWNPTKGYYSRQGLTLVGGFLFGTARLHPHRHDGGGLPHPVRHPGVRELEPAVRARRALRAVAHPAELFPARRPAVGDQSRTTPTSSTSTA